MTIGNLKRAINNFNDNMPVMIYSSNDINGQDIIPEEIRSVNIGRGFTVNEKTGEPSNKIMILLETI